MYFSPKNFQNNYDFNNKFDNENDAESTIDSFLMNTVILSMREWAER